MIYFYPAVIILCLGIILLIAGGLSRRLRVVTIIGLFLCFVPIGFWAVTLGLSNPKPVEWSYLRGSTVQVLSSQFDLKSKIWLWVRHGTDAPVYYVMGWDQDLAQELQDAMQESEMTGGGVMLEFPSDSSLEVRPAPRVYTTPQPAPPPKAPESPETHTEKRQGI